MNATVNGHISLLAYSPRSPSCLPLSWCFSNKIPEVVVTCRFPRLNPQGFSLHGSEGSHFSGAPSPGNSEEGGSEATPQGTILCPVETKSPLTALSHSQCREHAGSDASLSSHAGSTPGLEAQVLGPKGVRVGKPSWLFCHARWSWDLPRRCLPRRKAADCPLQSSKRPQASLSLLCSCSTTADHLCPL